MNKIKILIVLLIGVLTVSSIWFLSVKDDETDYITISDFESNLKSLSNSKIEVKDYTIKNGIYSTEWNGFTISSRVVDYEDKEVNKDDDIKLDKSYSILTKHQVYTNDVLEGDYIELMKCLLEIADPSLSSKDIKELIPKSKDMAKVVNEDPIILKGGFTSTVNTGNSFKGTINFTMKTEE